MEKRKKVEKLDRIDSESRSRTERRSEKVVCEGWFRMWMGDLAEYYSV